MISFDAYDLIGLWEQEQHLSAAERSLLLLGMACPDKSRDELGTMTIGERDRILLDLRRQLFGDQLEGLARCSHCDETLEVSVSISDFLRSVGATPPPPHGSLCVEEIEVTFRLPTINDAVVIERQHDHEQARGFLLKRCVVAAHHDGSPIASDDLDDITLARISQEMDELDPLSEICLSLTCFSCDHDESVFLDITPYLCTELSIEAERLLDEVTSLAREYGWREMDIVAMSGQRRKFYLDRRGI